MTSGQVSCGLDSARSGACERGLEEEAKIFSLPWVGLKVHRPLLTLAPRLQEGHSRRAGGKGEGGGVSLVLPRVQRTSRVLLDRCDICVLS